MTDQELLEKAAKAANIPCKGWCSPGARSDGWHGMYTGNDDDGAYQRWNPLNDDGDALRLAVRLNLGVSIREEGDDPYAATRRAIVRAAASLAD